MYKITNQAEDVILDIFGEIGSFGDNNAIDIKNFINDVMVSNPKTIKININSPGGDVNDALVIYDALKSCKAKKVVNFIGLVASAASVIGMCGDEINMSENSMLLIHRAMTGAQGNINDLKETVETLQTIDNILINIYKRQTGRRDYTIENLMNENNGHGRFLNAEEALEFGLIDKILPASTIFNLQEILSNKVILNSLTEEQIKSLQSQVDMTDDEFFDELEKIFKNPYPSEHAARIIEPEKFKQDSFRRQNITNGVDAIMGNLIGEETMTIQAYRFDKEKFTAEEAKKWLKDNDIQYISFEEAV